MATIKKIESNFKPNHLGLIPNNWSVKILGEVATFVNGKAYKQEELLQTGKYKVLRVGNFFTKGEWYYSDLELDKDKYVNDGDLMYAWSASFGPKFWHGKKTIYHYHIWKVLPSDMAIKEYLYYFLLFDAEKILQTKQGGTMFHVTKGDIEKRKITLPPRREQCTIVELLNTWSLAIEKYEMLIIQKDNTKKWLTRQLLTGKKKSGRI
jgi:type I restriction enzyme S subunit